MEFDRAMLFYKRFLWLVGLLPFDNRNFNYLGTHLLLGFYIVTGVANWSMYIFYGINGGAITVDYIDEIMLVYGMHGRYYMLLWQRKELKSLMDECELIWNECNKEEHRLVVKFERKVRKLFLYLLYTSNLINVLYILSAVNANRHAVYSNTTDTRVLPAKWFVVGRVDAWPGYEITFFLQVLLIFNTCMISSISDSTAPILMMFSCGYFATLKKRLDDMEKTKDREQFDREFIAAAKFHQRLLHFSLRIEKIGRMLFLCQLFCSGYNMSILGIKLAGNDPHRFKYLPTLFTSLGELLICQYAPNYLVDEIVTTFNFFFGAKLCRTLLILYSTILQSKAISTAAYSVANTLVKHRSNYGRLLVLVILRASRPVQMTAGGIVNLSMENFGQVMKSAFSFFMVLRSLNF